MKGMEYSIGNVKVLIDVEKTKSMYQSFERHLKDSSAAINYTRNVKLRLDALQCYFEPLGIDPFSFQDLQVESIDALKQMVCYCGFYPIEVENKEVLLSAIADSIEKDGFQDSILTDFGYELSFEEWNGMAAIFFFVKLPWLYFPL